MPEGGGCEEFTVRVLVAGASGVIGRQLVPLLGAAGHEVIALSRSPRETPGVRSVAADALDRPALHRSVLEAKPDAVVNLLTAIPPQLDPRHLARDFALTNRLRTEGTRNLLEAAHAAGATRIVAESLAYAYDPAADGICNEDAPLWRRPPRQFAPCPISSAGSPTASPANPRLQHATPERSWRRRRCTLTSGMQPTDQCIVKLEDAVAPPVEVIGSAAAGHPGRVHVLLHAWLLYKFVRYLRNYATGSASLPGSAGSHFRRICSTSSATRHAAKTTL